MKCLCCSKLEPKVERHFYTYNFRFSFSYLNVTLTSTIIFSCGNRTSPYGTNGGHQNVCTAHADNQLYLHYWLSHRSRWPIRSAAMAFSNYRGKGNRMVCCIFFYPFCLLPYAFQRRFKEGVIPKLLLRLEQHQVKKFREGRS